MRAVQESGGCLEIDIEGNQEHRGDDPRLSTSFQMLRRYGVAPLACKTPDEDD